MELKWGNSCIKLKWNERSRWIIEVKQLRHDHEILASFPVMQQLRPDLQRETYLKRIRRLQQNFRYRLIGVFKQNEIVAVAGFRIVENLAWGKHMYIDDLVTGEQHRKQGYAQRLFDWLLNEAKTQQCQEVHLDSGVQRFDAHRFYLKNHMMIRSHHFVKVLK